jgi:DNA-binding NarL/FixJ family response regulator
MIVSRAVRRYLQQHGLLFPAPTAKLSAREKEVLTLVASGKTSKAIAEVLRIGKATVEMYTESALDKLGAENRPHGIAKALTNGIITVLDGAHAEYENAKIQVLAAK